MKAYAIHPQTQELKDIAIFMQKMAQLALNAI